MENHGPSQSQELQLQIQVDPNRAHLEVSSTLCPDQAPQNISQSETEFRNHSISFQATKSNPEIQARQNFQENWNSRHQEPRPYCP